MLFLVGCVSTIEPNSQTYNPVKSNSSVKIIYTSISEIYIMTDNFGGIKPNKDTIQTAKNHCELHKKNAYILFKKAKPIAYFSIEAWDGSNKYYAAKKDHYEAYYIKMSKTNLGYRFICANSQSEAVNVGFGPRLTYLETSDFTIHPGYVEAIEFKRILSNDEINENARIAKAKQIKAGEILKERKKKEIAKLETKYKEDCLNSNEYEKCLYAAEKKYINDKKVLEEKLAAMSPKERHAYNCSNAFKFRKGTEKYNDCVFKLYTAELDMQRLELEKQVAEAQIQAAANQQARAEAVANAQIAAAKAAKRAASLNSSIQMMQMGSSMLGSSAPKSNSSFGIENRVRTTCRNVGGFLNCY